MNIFTKHDITTAPEGAAQVLSAAKERYGFIPHLAAYLAESPKVLEAVLKLSEYFDQTTLTAQEQQLVLLTVSALNGCSYCKTVHTALGKMAEMDDSTLKAILAFEPLGDARLEALRVFTKQVFEDKGWVDDKQVQVFLDAGFTRAQVFEVILGVALKTITNYSNHIAKAEPNAEFIEMAKSSVAA